MSAMDLSLPTTYYNMSNKSVRQCEMDKDVKNYNQNQETSKCFIFRTKEKDQKVETHQKKVWTRTEVNMYVRIHI